jgi:type III secretory pathway component EscV
MNWYLLFVKQGNKIDSRVCTHLLNPKELLSEISNKQFISFDNHTYFSTKRKVHESISKWDDTQTGQFTIRTELITEFRPLSGDPTQMKMTSERFQQPDLFELQIPSDLISLVKNSELMNKITQLRTQLSSEFNITVPNIRVRDNLELNDHTVKFLLQGNSKEDLTVEFENEIPSIINFLHSNIHKYKDLIA